MSDNPSFVLKAKVHEQVYFDQKPIPIVAPDEVLVEVKKTGICGSDVHFYSHGRIGDFCVNSDMVLGHESSGVISKVGSDIKNLKPGDRVAIEPGATCRKCEFCKTGRYQLCPHVVFAATPPHDGTLGRYYKVPSDLAYPLPPNLSLEDGAMMEPTAVAVHAVSKLGAFKTNQSIAVFGCGPVGILCMAVAKALGASRIVAVDIVPGRLEFAKSYAATDTFQPPALEKDESRVTYSKRSAAAMKEALGIAERGPNAIDLIIDASGAEVSIQTGIRVIKYGGTFVQVGMGAPDITIDMSVVLSKELILKGSFRYGPGDYPLAIALASQGKIDLKPLVSHRFPFNDAVTAFKTTRNGKSEDGKGVIKAIISGPDVDVDEV
ncbi:chaperonin 10-like protein [Hygrophoropsis aurantiaca]|uniref:Chaperonin 10-like protein n=1 Tax=Hygrophoropsis aurantiaca TaxID=72124 RepID=A0ACB8ALU5_9AGAM|nr:chaperonin 10-like protein [Hygrophoropsis aurantiaca]